MLIRLVIGLALLAAGDVAIAQSVCIDLGNAVEHQLKKSASDFADGITDNSAPRATLREVRTSNSLALARMNIELMGQNKCPPRTKPVDPMIYLGEALDCELATQRGEKDSPKCKLDEWRGLSSKTSKTEG